MINESAKKVLLALNTATSFSGIISQLLQIIRREIGQRLLFKPSPKVFHRIKFRSVRWKEADVNIRRLSEKLINLFSSMRQEAIPDYEDGGFELPVQLAQEVPNMSGIEVAVRKKPEIKPYTLSLRRDTQRRYCRNFLVRASSLKQDRGISPWRPGSTNDRRHKQTAFVYEDNTGFKPRCFFLIRGHSSFIQRLISFSSRSLAARWGFCGVQPRECRSLLT